MIVKHVGAIGEVARPGNSALSITVIVLTFNEEIHIERCLSRIKPLVQRVIVLDSYSTDRTVELAKACGAEVVQRPFRNQAEQFQWALDTCGIDTGWVLRLDADEYLEPAALAEISMRLTALPPDITGVDFKRKFYFMGRWIRWGGYYPIILTRLWRMGAARIEQRWMDEHVVLMRGRSTMFDKGDLVDENLAGVDAWMAKHNRYATRQMVDFINREYYLFDIDESGEGLGAQSRMKRLLRNRIFGSAPLYLRSICYFIYRYFLRMGFLDGRQGFVFHSLHAYCYFLLIDAKIDEARRFIAENGFETFRAHLARHHRIDLATERRRG
jgi:glycosyltransferase involved in cell wall biosynthesis